MQLFFPSSLRSAVYSAVVLTSLFAFGQVPSSTWYN